LPLRLLLVSAIIMAALGLGIVGFQSLRPAGPAVAPQPKVNILVVAHAVSGGTLLKDEDLSTITLPAGQAPEFSLTDTPEERSNLHGALVLRYLDKGARLMANDVLRPRDRGFLAAVLAPGMRAISVGVDAVTGAAGLIWPGDHVDLILTQQLDQNRPAGQRVAGETILTNARVIAVDQKLVQGANQAGAAGSVARTITLEVTPVQAERVAVGDRLGRLSVTVRAVEDANRHSDPSSPPIFASDVSGVDAGASPRAAGMLVIQGTEQREIRFP
jgi:pilus assembly protein CpaB